MTVISWLPVRNAVPIAQPADGVGASARGAAAFDEFEAAVSLLEQAEAATMRKHALNTTTGRSMSGAPHTSRTRRGSPRPGPAVPQSRSTMYRAIRCIWRWKNASYS